MTTRIRNATHVGRKDVNGGEAQDKVIVGELHFSGSYPTGGEPIPTDVLATINDLTVLSGPPYGAALVSAGRSPRVKVLNDGVEVANGTDLSGVVLKVELIGERL